MAPNAAGFGLQTDFEDLRIQQVEAVLEDVDDEAADDEDDDAVELDRATCPTAEGDHASPSRSREASGSIPPPFTNTNRRCSARNSRVMRTASVNTPRGGTALETSRRVRTY